MSYPTALPEWQAGILSGLRRRLWELVCASPGLHLRELQRQSETATGELVYHLTVLEKEGLIDSERFGGLRRFFTPQLGADERPILAGLQSPPKRRIILSLLSMARPTHRQLVEVTGMAPSTVTWHLQLLEGTGVVQKTTIEGSGYLLVRPELVRELLKRYRASFADELVDRFVNAWAQLSISSLSR